MAATALAARLCNHEATDIAAPSEIKSVALLATTVKAAIFSVLVFVPTFSSIIALDALSCCIGWALIFLFAQYPATVGGILTQLYLSVLLAILFLEGNYASQGLLESPQHPLTDSTPVAAITLSWLDPLIKLGALGPINPSQLWDVDSQLSVRSGL